LATYLATFLQSKDIKSTRCEESENNELARGFLANKCPPVGAQTARSDVVICSRSSASPVSFDGRLIGLAGGVV